MTNEKTRYHLLSRWVGSVLLGFLIVGGSFYAYLALISPWVLGLRWSIQLLVIETVVLPSTCCFIFLMSKLALEPQTGRALIKGFRQLAIAGGIIYSYGLSLAFFAFLFEELTPFLPLFYKGVLLPMLVNLAFIIVLPRTRLAARLRKLANDCDSEKTT
jgi:hypothetical protein